MEVSRKRGRVFLRSTFLRAEEARWEAGLLRPGDGGGRLLDRLVLLQQEEDSTTRTSRLCLTARLFQTPLRWPQTTGGERTDPPAEAQPCLWEATLCCPTRTERWWKSTRPCTAQPLPCLLPPPDPVPVLPLSHPLGTPRRPPPHSPGGDGDLLLGRPLLGTPRKEGRWCGTRNSLLGSTRPGGRRRQSVPSRPQRESKRQRLQLPCCLGITSRTSATSAVGLQVEVIGTMSDQTVV